MLPCGPIDLHTVQAPGAHAGEALLTGTLADVGSDRARPAKAAPVQAHLSALTGLRFLAAFAVFVSHLGVPATSPEWVRTMAKSGYAGVTLFFVLSGFVLALNYTGRLSTRRELWSYAVARVARLYPLYIVVLAYTVVTKWAELGRIPDHVVKHVLAVQAWDPNVYVAFGLVGPGWSIGVELFLYLTLPVLAIGLKVMDRSTRSLLLSASVVLLVIVSLAWWFSATGRGDLAITDPQSAQRWLYRMPLLRVGDFLLGILAARLYVRLRHDPRGPRLGLVLVVLAVPVSLWLSAQKSLVGSAWSWDAIYALPATAVILGLALGPLQPLARALSTKTMVLLGEASFAFYLVHKQVIDTQSRPRPWTVEVTGSSAATALSQFGLALALAIGLHVGLEKPARTKLRRLLDPASKRSSG